jgi:excisionase family DNA binding protein
VSNRPAGALLTARELAGLLGVSPETVLRWTRRGELPAIRLPGGAIRYRRDELDAWLTDHATAGPGGPAVAETPNPKPAPPGRSLNPPRDQGRYDGGC